MSLQFSGREGADHAQSPENKGLSRAGRSASVGFTPNMGYAESFHSEVRDEFLNREDFESEPQARALGALWREEYNTGRPHSSLDYETPAESSASCARYVPIDEDLPDLSSTESTNR